MIKICEICGTEFDAKRESARFCGATCRKKASRVSVTSTVNEAEKTDSVTQLVEDLPKKLNVTQSIILGRDDIYSPNYDLSEAGFIRRNKNWMDFSERFKVGIRKTVAKYKEMLAEELRKNQLMREGLPVL